MDNKSVDSSLKIILITIGIGIWVLVLQNAGVIPSEQNVYVSGGYIDIDAINRTVDVTGSVYVVGGVDVDNTVSISIDEVLGEDDKKYYYNNK